MSKQIRNYRGKHRGYLQNKVWKDTPERKGISPITMMWINFAGKARRFMEIRNKCRDLLKIKTLKGKKRQKVLDQFFGAYKVVYGE